MDVQTITLIPTSLENVDAKIEAVDLDGEGVICMDAHTKKAKVLASAVSDTLAVIGDHRRLEFHSNGCEDNCISFRRVWRTLMLTSRQLTRMAKM